MPGRPTSEPALTLLRYEPDSDRFVRSDKASLTPAILLKSSYLLPSGIAKAKQRFEKGNECRFDQPRGGVLTFFARVKAIDAG